MSVFVNSAVRVRSSSPVRGVGIGSVPAPLTLLNEAFPFALDLAPQVDSQKGQSFGAIPSSSWMGGSLRRFSRGYIVWC